MGFFKRAGLDVDVQVLGGGSAILAAVAGGSLNAGLGNPIPLALARKRGLRFVYIAPGYIFEDRGPALSQLVVAPSSPIRTAKDLEGKTMAVVGLGGLDPLAAYAWLEKNGADTTAVKFVELGPAAMGEAVASGRIDAALMNEPALGDALRSNKVRSVARPYDALGKVVMVAGVFSTEEWASKHADAIRRLQAALNDAAAWAVANPEQAGVILEKYTKSPTPRAREHHARTLEPGYIQPILDAAYRYKLISDPVSARDLIWKA
jgi:NitT/TauT family transport system substrate-binding protein